MNAKSKVFYSTFFLFFGSTSLLFSQTTSRAVIINLPLVALLDIEPNNSSVALNFTTPIEAGLAVTAPAVNTTKWLNYTSAIRAADAKRTISAQVDQVIPGIQLKLTAGSAIPSSGGTLGTTAGPVTLSTVPVAIITGIGGAFTGNGINNGHALSFSFVVTNYALLVKQNNKVITVTYTISN